MRRREPRRLPPATIAMRRILLRVVEWPQSIWRIGTIEDPSRGEQAGSRRRGPVWMCSRVDMDLRAKGSPGGKRLFDLVGRGRGEEVSVERLVD